MKVRLQKYLSNLGVDSRRKCEQYITEGLVKINGVVVTKLGTTIDPETDKVVFNEERIGDHKSKYISIMMNKPRGYVCTTSDKEGKTVFELIDKDFKDTLKTAGRLDKKSEGLLILSNDGELIYYLTHPSFNQRKVYHVMVSGAFNDRVMQQLNSQMNIDGYTIKPAEVKAIRPGNNPKRVLLRFILKEGRKRQIRKMCEQLNLEVHRLQRVQIKNLTLQGLRPGEWRFLTKKEVQDLKK
ncbi:MAG: Pseudouridine synthase [uncultured bacterium]|nr:MAG: Pseudouridine synthase [uncultured bacterium]